MPIPEPTKDENQDEFIERCMGDNLMNDEYPDNKQRYAVCQSQWDKEYNMKEREIRTFDLDTIEIRSEDDNPKIRGHAAVFNKMSENLGGFREVIEAGAFTDAIQKDDVRALFNHDPNYVLGRKKSGTLNLAEDENGLAIEIDPPETQWAKDLMVSIGRGDISQMSFAFSLRNKDGEDWENVEGNTPIRHLRSVKLYDISPVTYPAYSQTDVKIRALIGEDAIAVIDKAESGLELTEEERTTITNTIEKLRSYLPEDDNLGGQEFQGAVGRVDMLRRKLELIAID